jgi:hypothetical protein
MGSTQNCVCECRGATVWRRMRRVLALTSGSAALVLALAVPTAASAQQVATAATSLVFDKVTVVDVEQGKLVPDQRVVITGNRIEAIGRVGTVKVPKGAPVVDASGKYLIPGLWDMHIHPAGTNSSTPSAYPPSTYPMMFFSLLIANGVTGMRDAGSSVPIEKQVTWWRDILAGTRVGPPRELLAGPRFGEVYRDAPSGSGGTPSFLDVPALKRFLDSLKAAGMNFVKLYPFGYLEAAAARQAGLQFGGHVYDISAMEASDSGMSIIDHPTGGLDTLCWGAAATVERCRPLAERFQRNGTWFVPTLTRAIFQDSATWAGPGSALVFTRFRKRVDMFWAGSTLSGNWLRDSANVGGPPAPVERANADTNMIMSVLSRVGLPVLAGTDPDNSKDAMERMPPGFGIHAELAMYVAEGMGLVEALQTATLNPAKLIHGTDSLGTVAPGKLADLVLLDANPLDDITNTTTIRAVVANGRYFDRAALDSLLASVQAKAKEVKGP